MKATFGALLTMLVAASAAPYSSSPSSSIQLSGKQIQSLASVLAVHSIASKQDIDQVDQNISCTVAYTLALSTCIFNLYLRLH